MRHDSASILDLDGKEVSVFTPSQPREKWQRKRTHVKLRVRAGATPEEPESGGAATVQQGSEAGTHSPG